MVDEWLNIVITSELPEFLVVISLITDQNHNRRCVPFHYLWPNLCIVFPRSRGVNIENGVGRRIDQQRRLQMLDSEVRSLCVVS
jgi:hypothetical protein